MAKKKGLSKRQKKQIMVGGIVVAGIGALLYWLSKRVKAEEQIPTLPCGEIVTFEPGENLFIYPDATPIESRTFRQNIIAAGGTGVTVARWNQSTGIWDTQTALGSMFTIYHGDIIKVYTLTTVALIIPCI